MMALHVGMNPSLLDRQRQSEVVSRRLAKEADEYFGAKTFWIRGGYQCRTTADLDSLVQETEADIVFLDSGYLLRPQQKNLRVRWEQQAAVHEELKLGTAARRNVPIVETLQVNRDGKKSGSSDGVVAGSDVIEQLADILVHVRLGTGERGKDRRHLSIGKNRRDTDGGFEINFLFKPTPDFSPISWGDIAHDELIGLEGLESEL